METKLIYFASEAAEIIRNGGLVAVPTETVYGLAANGLDEAAVARIFEVKGRPENKPLSLLVSGKDSFTRYCMNVPKQAYTLAKKFWPGPLTIVLPAKGNIPSNVLAGGSTVGLRCPQHPVTLSLLERAKLPLAAPSANPSGMESPKTASKVMEYFGGKIDAVIDGGECGVGTESTIIDISRTPYAILREGALSSDTVFDCLVSEMSIVGVTGGSGTGKSTALEVLKDRGALIIDCDEVYHELTVSSAEMRDEIIGRFGNVYDGDMLDRKKLGDIVFADEKDLRDLNEITHKHVHLQVLKLLREHAASGGTLAAIEAIWLIGGRSEAMCDFIVGVSSSVNTRVQRLVGREGISEEYARKRIAAQKPDSYFEENCDYMLYNVGDKEHFIKKCEKFFTEVLG